MAVFSSNNNRGRDAAPTTSGGSTPPPGGKRGQFSILGPDVVITGNVAATADLHIDGRVDGDVACGNLIQGSDSHINGQVVAETARLAGAIDGSVSVRQLTIERSARITGDVEYESLSIENGAAVDGRLKHLSAGAPGRQAAARAVPATPASDAPAPSDIPAFLTPDATLN